MKNITPEAQPSSRFIPSDFEKDPTFEQIDLQKPRLFPSQKEVIQKTGTFRNLSLIFLAVAAACLLLVLPLGSTVSVSSATTRPDQWTEFSAPKDGFVTQVFFRRNEPVKKGQLLMRIVSEADQNALRETELQIARHKKEIEFEQTQSQIARIKLDEIKREKVLGSISESELRKGMLVEKAQHQKVEVLRYQVRRLEARHNYLERFLKEGELYAPYDGFINSEVAHRDQVFIEKGALLFTFASLEAHLEFLLPETKLQRVRAGSRAHIRFFSQPQDLYEGVVSEFRPELKNLSLGEEPLMRFFVRSPHLPQMIQQGMSAKVTVAARPMSFAERFYHEFF